LSANWTLARLNRIDLLILRLAIYEMLYVDDVPAKVALDEALQLAKEFSDDKSRRFINGVLSNLL
ncbi:transcription antitermination factor NusB, partial [Ligilactobacillus animalis]